MAVDWGGVWECGGLAAGMREWGMVLGEGDATCPLQHVQVVVYPEGREEFDFRDKGPGVGMRDEG